MPKENTRWIYDFTDGSKDMRELLGGKGAGVAEMTRVLGAERVPAGFTITTEACVEYMRADRTEPAGMAEQLEDALARLEEHAGKQLGDDTDPLLVSVRSGARESMPGMLDTVLNLGLNDTSVQGLASATENERFAWDSYRRFVQMFGNVSRGIEGERFEDAIAEIKRDRGVKQDTELDTDALKQLTETFQDDLPRSHRRGLPPGSPRAAAPGRAGGVRFLDRRAGGGVPAPEPHPRRMGHRGQRPADGVRQQGRHIGLRRGVLARRGDRRAGAQRGLPPQCPGRGRRLGRAHPARHRATARMDARSPRAADGDPAHPREPLQGHAGHGVHD